MKHTESGALTGRQLLELLQTIPEEQLDLPIHFAHPANDYWKTELGVEVSDIVPGCIVWSSYHDKFQVLNEDDIHKAEQVARGEQEPGEELQLERNGQPIMDALIIR